MLIPFRKRKKKKKLPRLRLIGKWTKELKARRNTHYHCTLCENDIWEGFYYIRKVYVYKGKMLIEREHSSPPCEFFFPDPHDDEKDKEVAHRLAA